MIDSISGDLGKSCSQIEGKFARAGAMLESTIALISNQLEYFKRLNVLLGDDAVAQATQQLETTAGEMRSLPNLLEVRRRELVDLESKSIGLLRNIEDMGNLFRYLVVFALNLKITAADNELDAQLFDVFAQEMRTRLEAGSTELKDIELRLNELIEQALAASKLESDLAEEAATMVSSVPNRLSDDANAIRDHQTQIADMTAHASMLAQSIQLKVIDALSSLQIGDISRQRIEHVQNGLQLLAAGDNRLLDAGASDDARQRFQQFVCRLLAAQLTDTAEAFAQDSRALLENMSAMASDARSLLQRQKAQSTSSDSGGNLRSLEHSVADAMTLVSDVEKAVATADRVRSEAALTVDELMRRVDSIKSVREDVQFMALNTTVSCSRMGDSGKPLQVIAIELRLYAKKLDSIADVTLEALRALGQDVASLDTEKPAVSAQFELDEAVARLRNAADLAETSIIAITAQGSEVVDSLLKAESELNFETDLCKVLSQSAASLQAIAGDDVISVEDVAEPLQDLLDSIARSYTMARERDIHAQFQTSPAAASARAA